MLISPALEFAPVEVVSDDTPIWRYMDLPKFVSMLESKALWFSKAACLEDGHEGFCQVSKLDMPLNDPSPKYFSRETETGETEHLTIEQWKVSVGNASAEYFENARDHLYVNSWCLADESMAMWEIYGSNGSGIAVKSSINRYRRAARFNVPKSQYAFDKITYGNSEPTVDFWGGSIPFPGAGVWEQLIREVAFHKRTCFIYEQEWRAVLYQDYRPDCPGCIIEFELDDLIDGVYVGPRATEFFHGVVDSVMKRFGLMKPLERSRLLQPPARRSASTHA